MEKEILMTALIGLAAIIAIVIIAVPAVQLPQTDGIGLTSKAKDKPQDLGLTFSISKQATGEGMPVVLTATTTKSVDSVFFSAQLGSCTVAIANLTSAPYQYTWNADGCGTGTYTLTATATHSSGKQQTNSTALLVVPVVQGYPVVPGSEVSTGDASYAVSTSANNYPPASGTFSNQNFADLNTPATVNPNEQLLFVISVNGQKAGTIPPSFDLDYQVYDVTAASALGSGVLANPDGPTNSSLVFTTTIPSPGSHEVVFQFKSSSLFSAVTLNAYDIQIYRIAQ